MGADLNFTMPNNVYSKTVVDLTDMKLPLISEETSGTKPLESDSSFALVTDSSIPPAKPLEHQCEDELISGLKEVCSESDEKYSEDFDQTEESKLQPMVQQAASDKLEDSNGTKSTLQSQFQDTKGSTDPLSQPISSGLFSGAGPRAAPIKLAEGSSTYAYPISTEESKSWNPIIEHDKSKE